MTWDPGEVLANEMEITMNKYSLARHVAVAALLLCTAISYSQQPKGRPDLLVSTQWLAAHLNDPKLVIIHIGNPDAYKNEHIPGARLADRNFVDKGTELPPIDKLKGVLEGMGISDDSRVVVYTPDWGPQATRLIFTLNYVGFDNAALLDGGFDKWLEEKRPTSPEVPPPAKGTLTVHTHPEIVATLEDVKQVTTGATPNTLILDARPLRRYRQGHLPGAVPFFWENNLKEAEALSQVLKSPDELRRMYVAAGARPGTKLVSYCEVGWQASYAYFIGRYLGYDARMYDGSYDEWSTQKQPSIRGDNAR